MGENDLLRQPQVPCLADLQTAALPLVPGKYDGLTALVRDEGKCLQDDRDENSHVLTDFFLEELLRTNVTGSNMFHLPESFQVPSLSGQPAPPFHLLICPSGVLLQPSDEE